MASSLPTSLVTGTHYAQVYGAARVGLLTASEEVRLTRDAQANDERAVERLISANVALVRHIARRYRSHVLTEDDLLQEGLLGLIQAIRRFNPDLGFRFSTYATYWIRQRISRAIETQSRIVHLPSGVQDSARVLRRAAARLANQVGRPPTPQELADDTGMDLSQVEGLLSVIQDPVSINERVGDAEGPTIEEQLPDEQSLNPEDVTLRADERLGVLALMDSLHPREREILELRYGYRGDGNPLTVVEVARELGMSREAVRQFESKALRKLRTLIRLKMPEEMF